ncbi:MAG: helix-turn-helix transcriptional regulator [Acidimicrobiia bacterium]|jgi:transcriptional regulator with XRE-family HTH domain
MDAGTLLREARARARLSQRELARRAGTSHATLSFYESGRKMPSYATVARIVRAAGFVLESDLAPVAGGADRAARGRELLEVLELAELFPARHEHTLPYPAFGRLG